MRPVGPALVTWALVAGGVLACGGKSAPCPEGTGNCSADARTLTVCEQGAWKTVDCLAERGQLCEAGQCLDPWRYGSPKWDHCDGGPLQVPETLHDKMVTFEDRAARLHLNPGLGWITPVTLPCKAPDNCLEPKVAEAEATWQDVEIFHTGENDGLWSALYLAAQAFRYGATRDSQALANIRMLLDAERVRMRITGVPGVFTRQFIPPGVAGIACPAALNPYIPDPTKTSNRWVRIGAGGCVETVDGTTRQWVTSTHCGLGEFAAWCFLDNVSKDEYAGHMFALLSLLKLVDDPAVQATVRDLLGQVGTHLVQNRLQLLDWDGRVTKHGRFFAMALDDWPDFNAAMALAFVSMALEATSDPTIQDFYDNCLLQRAGTQDCLQQPLETPKPYTDYLAQTLLYVGEDSCKSNWNNFSMHMLSLLDLIWVERDPAVRAAAQANLALVFAPADTPRPLKDQNNTWFDFIAAAFKQLGPDSDGPATAAVENGVCMLRQFPASKHWQAITCPPEQCQLSTCTNRFDEPMLDYARPIAQHCITGFVWWDSPYDPGDCPENRRMIEPPTDYLLAYWMGRTFGFIGEDQ